MFCKNHCMFSWPLRPHQHRCQQGKLRVCPSFASHFCLPLTGVSWSMESEGLDLAIPHVDLGMLIPSIPSIPNLRNVERMHRYDTGFTFLEGWELRTSLVTHGKAYAAELPVRSTVSFSCMQSSMIIVCAPTNNTRVDVGWDYRKPSQVTIHCGDFLDSSTPSFLNTLTINNRSPLFSVGSFICMFWNHLDINRRYTSFCSLAQHSFL